LIWRIFKKGLRSNEWKKKGRVSDRGKVKMERMIKEVNKKWKVRKRDRKNEEVIRM